MKITRMNEDLQNMSKVVKDKEIPVTTQMPVTMAAAVADSKATKKLVDDATDKAEVIDTAVPFTGASDKKVSTPALKKMHLSEELFENSTSEYLDLHRKISMYVYDIIMDRALGNLSARLFNAIDGYDPDWADEDGSTREARDINAAAETLANKVATDLLLHYNLAEQLKEAKTKPVEDLWTKVYNELSADMDPQDTHREIKAKKGERYHELKTDANGNIRIYTPTEEDLAFGKKVAEHYGVEYKIIQDQYLRSKYYKYVMTFYIPEDGVIDESKETMLDTIRFTGPALETFKRIRAAKKLTEFDSMITNLYPDGITRSELSEELSNHSDYIFESIGIK